MPEPQGHNIDERWMQVGMEHWVFGATFRPLLGQRSWLGLSLRSLDQFWPWRYIHQNFPGSITVMLGCSFRTCALDEQSAVEHWVKWQTRSHEFVALQVLVEYLPTSPIGK